MVDGLQHIAQNTSFSFEGNEGKYYNIDFKGHQLIESRGEKISGALDFIRKILSYKKIAKIVSFVRQIKEMNKSITPVLEQEIVLINSKLKVLMREFKIPKKKYFIFRKKKRKYDALKRKLKNQYIKENGRKKYSVNTEVIDEAFNHEFPEHQNFLEEFGEVKAKYDELRQKISHLKNIKSKIEKHFEKINNYFKK